MDVEMATPSSWSELSPELIGQVLLRLPSLVDRVRFRAVCRPWRAGAQQQQKLPPPLPWLALRDGTLVDNHGAPVHCATPILHQGVTDYLAVDNLAFLVHKQGGCSLINPLSGGCSLVNPLSRLAPEIPLPQLAKAVLRAMVDSKFYIQGRTRMPYVKVILSSPLDSLPDPLIAALILEDSYYAISACKRHEAIGIGSIIDCTQEIYKKTNKTHLADIAFLHGRLNALTRQEGLYVFGLNSGCQNVTSGFHQCITDDSQHQLIYAKIDKDNYMVPRYLVECGGRLFIVRRWMRIPLNAQLGVVERTCRFDVFEADLTTSPCQWRKVDNLGGQAIFLGSQCVKFVRASNCIGGVQEDCIYFMHWIFDNPSREYFGRCVDPLGDSGVYNMKNGDITPLLPEAVMVELRLKRQFLTWFFPANI